MKGFSLIELLTVLVIIGILVAVALPSYQHYVQRAHYSEIVSAVAPYKAGVETCYQIEDNLNNCNAGENEVPQPVNSGESPGLVDQIQVARGEIKVIPKDKNGIHPDDDLILTPKTVHGYLKWHRHGGGVAHGYVKS